MDQFEIELQEAAAQRTQVWRDQRAGKFTASEIWKLFVEPRSKAAKEAGEWSDTAMTYIRAKVAEELTGLVHESSRAYPIVWGEEQEKMAAVEFEDATGLKVKKAGFVKFTDHSGGSPDGYVEEDAILEIKCPYNSGNQVDYLLIVHALEIKEYWPEYWFQMQANMLFTKLNKCYFVAYDPRIPEKNRIKVVEVKADPEEQQAILDKIGKAIEEKLKLIQTLTPHDTNK